MGQQQLLILVFGIVLVGGVVVAGIHALDAPKMVENRAIVFQEGLAIVDALQRWKRKPSVAGGGANLVGFDLVNFGEVGISYALLSKRVHKTDYACYVLRTIGPENFAEVMISAPSCAPEDYVARAIVRGPTAADLDWVR